jgi:hypothetical protein
MVRGDLLAGVTMILIAAAGVRPGSARAMARRILWVVACREIFRLDRREIEEALGISVRTQQREMLVWKEAIAREGEGSEQETDDVFDMDAGEAEEAAALMRRAARHRPAREVAASL